ncbi:hypothetical protein I312_104095 [Cryptococcus bacillisporus CA1280]|uniref:uncharacterized protein n=1 Tax=Cryptococcus bacillisporus CA1280 TaxID=1296109 RepID=UPI0033675AE4
MTRSPTHRPRLETWVIMMMYTPPEQQDSEASSPRVGDDLEHLSVARSELLRSLLPLHCGRRARGRGRWET